MIYLDNAATTPLLPEVVEVMSDALQFSFGNPSSIHSAGRRAAQLIRESREMVAQVLEVPANHLIFTSGASEANNQALIGYTLAHRNQGNHLITTAIEHPSVLNTMNYLQERYGFEITFIKPEADGSFSIDAFEKALRPDTLLVSMMWANNETGQLLPVAEIGKILSHHPAIFHVDATQVMGKIPVHPRAFGIDLLSASAHKFHGPKGVGFLYQNDVKLDALLHGGDQENKRRAGTENLASLVGMAKALELAAQKMPQNFEHVKKLNLTVLSNLTGIAFYKNEFGETMPHVLNLGFPQQNHDLLLTKLDMAGVAISTGSACTAGTVEPSHVLEAVYGENAAKLKENIRISFSELNTFDEVVKFTELLKKSLQG